MGGRLTVATPALTDKALILLVETPGPAYLLAIDKTSVQNLWKVDRTPRMSWSSPMVTKDLVVIGASQVGSNLASIEAAWRRAKRRGATILNPPP